MAEARDPWWLIGSAAMALHGAPVTVADIDLLTSVDDARRLFGDRLAPGAPSTLFRSDLFGRWRIGAFEVEVMAGLALRGEVGWQPVELAGRERVVLDGQPLFTPGVAGLITLCRRFGRPKDEARAKLLAGLG